MDPRFFYHVGLILRMTTFLQVTIHEDQLTKENMEEFEKSCVYARSDAKVIFYERP